MRFYILASILSLSSTAAAQTRAIMEGVAASRYTIKVDTANGRVDIATTSYTGGIVNVGLFVASNVVVGNLTTKNACVLYSTGSATCVSFRGDGSALTSVGGGVSLTSTQTFSGANTFVSSFTFSTGISGGGASTKVSGTVARSTQIVTSSNQTAGTVAWACYSTITFMSNGGTWLVTFTGSMLGGASDLGHTGFLIDGAIPSPWTSAKGIVYLAIATDKNMGYPALVPNIAAGARSVCASFWRDAGSTGTLQCSDRATCVLSVVEF